MQKQRVQQLLDSFPDDVNVDAILEKVYLLDKIEAGDTVPHDEAKRRLQKWLA
jgi:hypothetical protein